MDGADGLAHLHTQLGIQVGKGLIHQQHIRLNDQRACQRHALLLAAGEALRLAVGILLNVHQLHELFRLSEHFGLVHLFGLVLEAEHHVVAYGQVGENGIVLEHHNAALAGIDIVDAGIVEVEIAALDGVEAGAHAQQGGLAAAGGAKQGKELAFADPDGQIFNHHIAAVAFVGMVYLDGNAHENASSFVAEKSSLDRGTSWTFPSLGRCASGACRFVAKKASLDRETSWIFRTLVDVPPAHAGLLSMGFRTR